MKTLVIGDKFEGKYSYRETCFGIVRNKDSFLVVEKNNQYSLVGGGIEENETYKECLKREFLEESGYEIKHIEELVCIDCFWLAAGKYPMESKANIFVVEIDLNNKEVLEDDCIPRWISEEELKSKLPLPYHKKAIEYYLEFYNKK